MTQTTTPRPPRDLDDLPADPDDVDPVDDPRPEPVRVELSVTQLAAGALAAMTAAVAGAQLGVGGTVIGAALGSVVAGVASSLYTASLRRGGRALARTPLAARAGSTALLPVASSVSSSRPARGAVRRPRFLRRRWRSLAVTAAVVFAIAVAGITAAELLTGRAVSGGPGTTISQVGEGRGASSDDDRGQTPSDEQSTSPTEDPSDTATDDPTETPSERPSEVPTEDPTTPTPTDEPTDTPTEEPTNPTSPAPTPSPEPTAP